MYLRKVAYQLEVRVKSLVPCFHKSHLQNLALLVVGIAYRPYLINGDMEEYRRYLELYLLLDEELTRKLAHRALAHSDPDVIEAGQDFIEILGDENRIKEARERLAAD